MTETLESLLGIPSDSTVVNCNNNEGHQEEDEEAEVFCQDCSDKAATVKRIIDQKSQDLCSDCALKKPLIADPIIMSSASPDAAASAAAAVVGPSHPFNYFLVVGVDPSVDTSDRSTVHHAPEILYTYPEMGSLEYVAPDSRLANFCFPSGVPVRPVAADLDLHTALCTTPDPALSASSTSPPSAATAPASTSLLPLTPLTAPFGFLFTGGPSVLYCSAVWHVEPLSRHPSLVAATTPPKVSSSNAANISTTTTAAAGAAVTVASTAAPSAPAPTKYTAGGRDRSSSDANASLQFVTQRCYLFVSQLPCFEVHFAMLRVLLNQERLLFTAQLGSQQTANAPATSSACERCQNQNHQLAATVALSPSLSVQLCRPCTLVSQSIAQRLAGAAEPETSAPNTVVQLLSLYHQTDCPSSSGQTVEFAVPGEKLGRSLSFDSNFGPLTLDQVTSAFMATAAANLSLDHLLLLFNAVLLERRVLVKSSRDLSAASACVMSILSMLSPFKWQGLVIPVLPNDKEDFLDAPVPYVIGVQRIRSRTLECVLFDLDCGKVTHSGTTVAVACSADGNLKTGEPLPGLPEGKKLMANLKEAHGRIRDLVKQRGRGFHMSVLTQTAEQRAAGHSLVAAFHGWTQWLLGKVERHFKSIIELSGFLDSNGDSGAAAKQTFVQSQVSNHNRLFVQMLFSTQHFSAWFDNFVQNSSLRRWSTPSKKNNQKQHDRIKKQPPAT